MVKMMLLKIAESLKARAEKQLQTQMAA